MNTSNFGKKSLIGLSLLTAGLCAGCGQNYSNGERVGVVTKLSEKGIIFKSWEGEMLIALPVAVAGTTQPEKFTFNVATEAVDQVKKAMASGQRVEVVYRQWFLSPPTIDNEHVVTAVKSAE